MGFRKGNYATVWSVEEGKGNMLKVRISTSRKNKETNQYEQDFSGYCLFIGNAKAKGEKLKEKDRIILGDVDVTTWYSKEKKTEYVSYKVFDFEDADKNESSKGASSKSAGRSTKRKSALDDDVEDGDSGDDLPF